MTADTQKRRERVVASCPWCGPGTELQVRGDGYGGVAVACTKCGAAGPPALVEEDFNAADQAALARWSARHADIEAELLERIRLSKDMASLLSGGKLSDETEVSVRYGDLRDLVRATTRH